MVQSAFSSLTGLHLAAAQREQATRSLFHGGLGLRLRGDLVQELSVTIRSHRTKAIRSVGSPPCFASKRLCMAADKSFAIILGFPLAWEVLFIFLFHVIMFLLVNHGLSD